MRFVAGLVTVGKSCLVAIHFDCGLMILSPAAGEKLYEASRAGLVWSSLGLLFEWLWLLLLLLRLRQQLLLALQLLH